jgi:hypothetical protein
MKHAYLAALGVFGAVLTIVAAATLVLPGLAGSVTAGGSDGPSFQARLRGSEEVTTPPGGVMTRTRGSAEFEFNESLTAIEFELEVKRGTRVTQAHIHCAPAGSNGPVIIFLAGLHERGFDVDGDWIGDATVTDANIVDTTCGATLAEIATAMAEGRTYVNVHTIANPAGEVRGQILAENDDDDDDDDDD